MAAITLKVSEQDKLFMQAMAKFEGVSLSELIRTKTLEALEDEYDVRVADIAWADRRLSGRRCRQQARLRNSGAWRNFCERAIVPFGIVMHR